jgi:hypothetical protein
MTFAFGVIPIGVRTLHVEKIDQKNYEIQSREHDPLIARWDHLVSIKPLDDTRSIYRDTIDIDAGSLPFVVGAWANCHRHVVGVRLQQHCDRPRPLRVKGCRTKAPLNTAGAPP